MASKRTALLLLWALPVSALAQQAAMAPKPAPAAATQVRPGITRDMRDAILAQRWSDVRPQLESLAASGNVDGMVTLGTLLTRGFDGKKDAKRGQKLLGDAAARGNGVARRLLAQYYFRGEFNNGVPEYSKAWAFIYPMAQSEDPMGLYLAGKIIRDGLLGSPNEAVGREMILQAATRGWPDAQRELSGIGTIDLTAATTQTDDKNKPLSSLDILKRAAQKGNVDALWQLGLINFYGVGVSADQSLAKSWFQKGAAKGDVASAILLSHLNNETKLSPLVMAGIRKSRQRAGDAYAVIARQLIEGRGTDIDMDRAATFALVAGDLGSSESFELVSLAKSKLSAEAFAKAEENFRSWRTEVLPSG